MLFTLPAWVDVSETELSCRTLFFEDQWLKIKQMCGVGHMDAAVVKLCGVFLIPDHFNLQEYFGLLPHLICKVSQQLYQSALNWHDFN